MLKRDGVELSSRLTVAEFCRCKKVNAGLFRRWRAALEGTQRVSEWPPRARSLVVSTPAAPGRVPFIDLGSMGGGGRCEVRLEFGGGLVLRVVRG